MAKKILLIDDDPKILRLEQAILTGAGFTVETASGGPEAIEVLSTKEYDAVVLDIVMPGMDGYEVARRIRQLDTNRDTPVVMVTALGERDAMKRGFDVGAMVFLKKPFTAEALRSAVRSVVRQPVVGFAARRSSSGRLDNEVARASRRGPQRADRGPKKSPVLRSGRSR